MGGATATAFPRTARLGDAAAAPSSSPLPNPGDKPFLPNTRCAPVHTPQDPWPPSPPHTPTPQLLKSSPVLLAVVLTDIVALLGLNVSGMCVTGHFGAVFRTVLETTRTLAVWLVGLLLYYTPLGGGRLGESWNKYSWIQALGFVVLVTGTVVYGKGDEEAEAAEAEAEGLAPLDETLVPAGSGAGWGRKGGKRGGCWAQVCRVLCGMTCLLGGG